MSPTLGFTFWTVDHHLCIMGGYECNLAALDLPADLVAFVSKKWGIDVLHPPQAEAMPAVLAGRNTMLCIPTASGKSLVAYLAIAKTLLQTKKGSRAIYIVPLKALASEKQQELVELGDALGLKVGLGIGDAPGEARKIEDCDILVCTSEKLDSLIRSKPEILGRTSVVVADEFHLLNDSTRGPTMEINLTRIRTLRPNAQIITLSATVGNSDDLAKWLDSELIVSNWRPVSLESSTLAELDLEPRSVQQNQSDTTSTLNPPRRLDGPKSHVAWAALKDVHEQGGQLLVFVSIRRSAESEAKKLGQRMAKLLQKSDPHSIKKLNELSQKLRLGSHSVMGDNLAEAVKGGVAFHHAGLRPEQRSLIEDAFKQRLLYCLCATPTLAAGVNLPARRVLVRDLKRYSDGMSRYLSVMEVRQMMGRAGRPQYDPKGEAWLACKGGDPRELADEIADKYIHGPVEDISSKLASEPAMRFHLLAGIATGGLLKRGDIGDFFASTYLGHTQPQGYLQETIDKMLSWLVSKRFIRRTEQHSMTESWDDETPAWLDSALAASGVSLGGVNKSKLEPREATFGFKRASSIVRQEPDTFLGESVDNRYEATAMGERIAQLMIDPLSADVMITGLRRAVRRLVRKDLPVTEFGICHLVTATPDFLPFYAKTSELVFGSDLMRKSAIHEDDLLVESPLEERALGLIKSAWCIEEWYEESDLRAIEQTIGISPGDVHTRVNLMGWLLVAAREVLLRDDVFADEHLGYVADLAGFIDLICRRVRAGCKEDLLQLIQVKNIGRTRARTLSKIGVRTPADLLSLSHKELDSLKSRRGWGPLMVERMLEEVRKLTRKTSDIKPRRDDDPLPSERV